MDRVGEGEACAIPPAGVASRKQQSDGLQTRVHDQRSAVSAIAERFGACAFNLYLPVKAQVADVVVDDDVVEIEGGDAALGGSGCATRFCRQSRPRR